MIHGATVENRANSRFERVCLLWVSGLFYASLFTSLMQEEKPQSLVGWQSNKMNKTVTVNPMKTGQ